MTITTYAVTGMTCSHCENSVRDEVAKLDGVTAIDVSAASGSLVITSATEIDDATVRAAVDEAGYSATRV